MKKSDVVLITHKDWAHIGIVGDCKYHQQYDNDKDSMCHRRSVECHKAKSMLATRDDPAK